MSELTSKEAQDKSTQELYNGLMKSHYEFIKLIRSRFDLTDEERNDYAQKIKESTKEALSAPIFHEKLSTFGK